MLFLCDLIPYPSENCVSSLYANQPAFLNFVSHKFIHARQSLSMAGGMQLYLCPVTTCNFTLCRSSIYDGQMFLILCPAGTSYLCWAKFHFMAGGSSFTPGARPKYCPKTYLRHWTLHRTALDLHTLLLLLLLLWLNVANKPAYLLYHIQWL